MQDSATLTPALPNHLSRHIRQPVVAAGVPIGQAFVIEPHQVQDRGMEVMDVDRDPWRR